MGKGIFAGADLHVHGWDGMACCLEEAMAGAMKMMKMLRIEKQCLCHRRQLGAGSIPARHIRRNLSYKKEKKGKGGAMENPVT